MGYLYTVMWFMMALLLYSKFKNEGKIVYILSGYFLFAGKNIGESNEKGHPSFLRRVHRSLCMR